MIAILPQFYSYTKFTPYTRIEAAMTNKELVVNTENTNEQNGIWKSQISIQSTCPAEHVAQQRRYVLIK